MHGSLPISFFFFFNDTATTEIYTLSLHDALPISPAPAMRQAASTPADATANPVSSLAAVASDAPTPATQVARLRSEEHTSELQSLRHLVCRLLLEKKKKPASTRDTRTSATPDPLH